MRAPPPPRTRLSWLGAGKGRLRRFLPTLAGLAGAGACYFLGFIGFGLWPLTFFALPIALLLLWRRPAFSRVAGAVCFGGFALSGGFYWVAHMLKTFAYVPWPVAVFGLVLLVVYQGLALALLIIGTIAAHRRLGVRPTWALMALWPTAEFVFPALFPHYVGAGLYRLTWLTQIVDITGMLGLTVLVAAVSGALFETIAAWCRLSIGPGSLWKPWAVVLTLLSIFLMYGAVRLDQIDRQVAGASRFKVGLVQTNLGARRIRGPRVPFVETHQAMTADLMAEHPDVELVVWPESGYNRLLPRRLIDVKRRVLPQTDAPLLFGATTYRRRDGKIQRFNSAVLMDPAGAVLGRFDKIKLLMFGETVPLVETWPWLRDQMPGQLLWSGRDYVGLQLGAVKMLPMICYEDILPGFVRTLWRRAGPADVLVNLTNDSWYGDSHEPLIHLVLASFRAIETRRALIRSTNTGISAVVDPAGRIVARTGQWTKENLVYDVPRMLDGESTVFMTIGPVIGWAGLGLTVLGLWVAFRRSRSTAGPATPSASGAAMLMGLAAALGGCSTAQIPYDLETISPRSGPRHPVRVAVLPLVDGRRPDERAEGGSDRFVFRGLEYVGTVMEDLDGTPSHRVTEVLARHLARRRTFAQVILVLSEDQAPNADLFLDGRILRLRGYVEANAPSEKSKRPPDERKVLAEVVLEDLRLRNRDGQILLQSDAGWSLLETRRLGPDGDPPQPWSVMSEALRVALADFATLVEGADLSGRFEIKTPVALKPSTSTVTAEGPFGDLAARGPYGWRFVEETPTAPVGWRSDKTCAAASFRWQQTRRFHRVIGPYQPRVRLWACSMNAPFRFDTKTEFPAELLGDGPGGRYFVWSLGETNWPESMAELRTRLGVQAPASRYIFEVGPGAPAAQPSPPSTPLRHRRRTPFRPESSSPSTE